MESNNYDDIQFKFVEFLTIQKKINEYMNLIDNLDNLIDINGFKDFLKSINPLFLNNFFSEQNIDKIIQKGTIEYSKKLIEGFSEEKTIVVCILYEICNKMLELIIGINLNLIFEDIEKNINHLDLYYIRLKFEAFILMIKKTIFIIIYKSLKMTNEQKNKEIQKCFTILNAILSDVNSNFDNFNSKTSVNFIKETTYHNIYNFIMNNSYTSNLFL